MRPSTFLRSASLLLALALLSAASLTAAGKTHGLPLIRSYPLQDISKATRLGVLGFDPYGRVALVADGSFSVLNDTTWIDLSAPSGPKQQSVIAVQTDQKGKLYYSGLGSWGTLSLGEDGHLQPLSTRNTAAPAWTHGTSFRWILPLEEGVYFGGWNGVVYQDHKSGKTYYIEISGITALFQAGGEAYISTHSHGLLRLNPQADERVHIDDFPDSTSVTASADLNKESVLLALRDGRMLVLEEGRVEPWAAQQKSGLSGHVLALARLSDGAIALAISGQGLFILSQEGELITSLTTSNYHRISSLATREAGILWVMTEEAVEQIAYGNPLSSVGQNLGLPVSWPIVAAWNGTTVVASEGSLFEASTGTGAAPSGFQLMTHQITGGAWAMASDGKELLVGNAKGVRVIGQDRIPKTLFANLDASQIALTPSGLCFVIGKVEIAVLKKTQGEWKECAPRIRNAGDPSIIQISKKHDSVWMEYGADKVGRVSFKEGHLSLLIIKEKEWVQSTWVNIGIVDDIVIFTPSASPKRYFDERTDSFCEAPHLEKLFTLAPQVVMRVWKDSNGILWASHRQGMITFTPKGQGYDMDATSFGYIADLYPRIQMIDGNDIWISGPRSLYHVEHYKGNNSTAASKPLLTSLVDARSGKELLGSLSGAAPPSFPYGQNELRLLFFSGSYAGLRGRHYEYRLNRDGVWAPLELGSSLNLSALSEGLYRLEVRLAESGTNKSNPSNESLQVEFTIRPPWYRTGYAYTAYLLLFALFVIAIIRVAGARTRHRNLQLEKLIGERTRELENTMQQLNEETRIAATLAERNRLAGEIHDSLQQGLCGAILQLDTTIKHPALNEPIRSRLDTVRSMISFTRHEVQNAIWDMESPILVGNDLGGALRKLTSLITVGTAAVDLQIEGNPLPLKSEVQHHLLRITQESTTNAVRHASASKISILLAYSPSHVSLSISDDGVGFTPETVLEKRTGHFGLQGIQARARKLNSQLVIQSAPGKGSSIRISVPIS